MRKYRITNWADGVAYFETELSNDEHALIMRIIVGLGDGEVGNYAPHLEIEELEG